MRKLIVTTDSNSGISRKIANDYNIPIFSIGYTFNGIVYDDIVNDHMSYTEIFKLATNERFVKENYVNAEALENFFAGYINKGFSIIHVSSFATNQRSAGIIEGAVSNLKDPDCKKIINNHRDFNLEIINVKHPLTCQQVITFEFYKMIKYGRYASEDDFIKKAMHINNSIKSVILTYNLRVKECKSRFEMEKGNSNVNILKRKAVFYMDKGRLKILKSFLTKKSAYRYYIDFIANECKNFDGEIVLAAGVDDLEDDNKVGKIKDIVKPTIPRVIHTSASFFNLIGVNHLVTTFYKKDANDD